MLSVGGFLIFLLLLSGLIISPVFAQTIEPPLKQYDSKTDPHKIKCKPNLTLVFKEGVWSPACVKPTSVEKLIERGWASKHNPHHMIVPPEKMFFTLQGDDQVGSLNMATWNAGPKMTYISSNSDGSLILATSVSVLARKLS